MAPHSTNPRGKKTPRWHRHRTIQLHCAAAASNGARTALGNAPRKRWFRMGEVTGPNHGNVPNHVGFQMCFSRNWMFLMYLNVTFGIDMSKPNLAKSPCLLSKMAENPSPPKRKRGMSSTKCGKKC